MQDKINGNEQIRWITSLRGLLVFLVFFSHLKIPIVHIDFLFVVGRIGVVGFFMISGYLAVASVSRRNVGQFWFNRFMRIYPMFWLLLLMVYLLSGDYTIREFLWNFTLFEEFVGCEKIIVPSWMMPIMVIFFAFLPFVAKNEKRMNAAWWIVWLVCLSGSILRYATGKPFPAALCLLINIGLLGFMDRQTEKHKIMIRIGIYEMLLMVCAYLSYQDRAVYYVVAYSLGFAVYYIFKYSRLNISALDKLGELGFTFFLGAAIPMMILAKVFPSIADVGWLCYAILHFLLTLLFSFILTRWCERPLLAWSKKMERRFT